MATGQIETIYDPSPDDPRITDAIDAQTRLEAAMMSVDVPTAELLTAPDVVVHAPINMVVTRENVLGRLRSGQISYDSVERTIAFAGVRGDTVVLMGEEVVTPNRDAES